MFKTKKAVASSQKQPLSKPRKVGNTQKLIL